MFASWIATKCECLSFIGQPLLELRWDSSQSLTLVNGVNNLKWLHDARSIVLDRSSFKTAVSGMLFDQVWAVNKSMDVLDHNANWIWHPALHHSHIPVHSVEGSLGRHRYDLRFCKHYLSLFSEGNNIIDRRKV